MKNKLLVITVGLLAVTALAQEQFTVQTNTVTVIPPLVITNDVPLIAGQLEGITNSSGQPVMGSLDPAMVHDINIRIVSTNKLVVTVR